MTTVHVTHEITIKLSQAEFRLVGLSLAGRVRTKEDIRACERLNRRLMKLREEEVKTNLLMADGAMKAAARVEAAGEAQVTCALKKGKP